MFRARTDFFELVLENEFNTEICVLSVPNASKATAYNRVCVAYNIVEFLKSTIYDFNCQLVVKHDWGVPCLISNRIQELTPSVIYGTLTCHYQHTKNAGVYHVQFKGEPRHFPATGYTIDIKDLDPIPYDVLATLSQSYPELEAVLQQDEYKKDLERNEKILEEDIKVQKVVDEQRENLRKMLQGLSDSFDQMAKCSDKRDDSPSEPSEMLSTECKKGNKCDRFHCPSCDICYKNRTALVAHIDSTHIGPNAKSTSPLRFNKCHLCNVSFPKIKFLDQHLKMHAIKARVESEQKNYEQASLYKCPTCNIRFATIVELSNHIQKDHLLSKEMGINDARKNPLDNPHGSCNVVKTSCKKGTEPWFDGLHHCRHCEQSFKEVKSLNAHLKSHAMKAYAEQVEARQKHIENGNKKIEDMLNPEQYPLRSSPYTGGLSRELAESVITKSLEIVEQPKQVAQPAADGFFHCSLCDKFYEKVKSLNAHMKAHAIKARAEQEAAKQKQEQDERMDTQPKIELKQEKRIPHYPIRPQLPCRIYSNNPYLGLDSSVPSFFPHMGMKKQLPSIPNRKIGHVLDRTTVPKTPEKFFLSDDEEPEEPLTEILKKFAAALDAEKKSPVKPRSLMTDEELVDDIEAQQNTIMKSSAFTLKGESPLINLSRPPRPGRVIAQEIAASPLQKDDGDAMPVQVRMAFNDYQDGRLSYFDMRDLLDCLKEIQLEQGMKTALDIAIDSLELLEIQKRHERKRTNSGDEDEFSAKSMKITEARLKELFSQGDVPDQEMGRSTNEASRPSCSKEKLQVKEYASPKVSEEKPIKIVDMPPKEFFYRTNVTVEETRLPQDIMLVQIHNTPMKAYGKWCKHLKLPVFEQYLKFEVTKPEVEFEPIAIQLGGNNVQEYYVQSCTMIRETEKKAIMSMHLFVVGIFDQETVSLVLQLVDKKNENRPLSNYIYLSGKYDKDPYKPCFYNVHCKMGSGHPLPKRQNPFFNIRAADCESVKSKLDNWKSKLTKDNLVVYKESDLVYMGNWCSHVGMPVFKKTIRVRTIDGKAFKPEKWTMQMVKNENLNTVMMPFVPKSHQSQFCRKLDLDLIMIVEDPLKKASAVLQFNKRSSSDTVPFFMSYSFMVDERTPSNMYFKDCDQPKAHPWPAQQKIQKFYPNKIANLILSNPTVVHGPVPPSRITVAYQSQPMEVTLITLDDHLEQEKSDEAMNMPAKMEVVKGDSFSSHTDMQKMNEETAKISEEAKETGHVKQFMKLSDFCEKKIEEEKTKAVEETKESEELPSPHDTLEFDFVEEADAELTEAEEANQPTEENKEAETGADCVLDTSDSSDFEMVGNSDTEEI